MVKSVLMYRAETCSLYEDDRRRIDESEMDELRRSARISKLDRKTNVYIKGKMDAQDMILDDITRKKIIRYGHVERMDPTRLPKIMIHWKPEGRKDKTRPSPENVERWNIYRHEWKRFKNGRMEQSKKMECESRKASSDVLKPRNIYKMKGSVVLLRSQKRVREQKIIAKQCHCLRF
jgi:hypothetical protein